MVRTIDQQARAWQRKLVECWCGPCPRLFSFKNGLVAALAMKHGLQTLPVPGDRLELIRAATRREDPSHEAFVGLALVDYVEDLESGVGSALLPYQLAWARAGHALTTTTGLPSGIRQAIWPRVPEPRT